MLNFIHTKKLNIFKQLKLEKKLLKEIDKPFCIINEGTASSIILGISNVAKDLVKIDLAQMDKIPIIQRFTAGGCVFVDENTLFVTFIFSKNFLSIPLFPESILKWAETFYKKVFKFKNFKLIDNDFAIGNKKVAGNAMYIKKDRFLLHTSFLLDYDIQKMKKYLKMPKKTPAYRKNRSHENFLYPLKKKYSKKEVISKIKFALKETFVKLINWNLSDLNSVWEKN